MTGDPKPQTHANAPSLPCASIAPTRAIERVSTQERIKGRVGCDAANRSHAGSLSEALLVLQPNICVHCLLSPTNRHDLLPYFPSHQPSLDSGCHNPPPAPTPARPAVRCPALLLRCSLRAAATADPLQSPPGAGLPLTRREGQATRLDGRRRRAAAAGLRSVASGVGEGGQHANHPESRKSPCGSRRPSGKSVQAARGWHVPGRAVGRRRPREGRGAGSRLQGECAPTRSPVPPRRRAPRPRPGGSENAERGHRRGIQAAPRAHAHPGSAPKARSVPGSQWRGKSESVRPAGQTGLTPRAAGRAELGAG